jgi:hypothetical protein
MGMAKAHRLGGHVGEGWQLHSSLRTVKGSELVLPPGCKGVVVAVRDALKRMASPSCVSIPHRVSRPHPPPHPDPPLTLPLPSV